MDHRGQSCFVLVLAVLFLGINVHCKQCDRGEFLHSNTCHTCPPHCASCTSSLYCTSCEYGWLGPTCRCTEGFYSEHDICKKCPDGCKACTDESSCKMCTYEMWGETVYCSSFCRVSGISSKGCKDGYYITPGNYCLPCPNVCATCRSVLYCDTCVPGRWGSYCPFNCSIGCSECFGSSNKQCSKCKDGYTLSEYTCNAIQSPVECPTCITPFNGTRCIDGSFLSGHTCQQCPVGCAICSSVSNCTSCSTDYYKPGHACKGDQLCIPVDGLCDNGCIDGWKGNKCDQLCGDNCSRCEQFSGICVKCEAGRYGRNCDQTCSKHCKASHGHADVATCNTHNGSCNNGCEGQVMGLTCDKDATQSDQQVNTYTVLLGGLAGGSVFLLMAAGVIVTCIITRRRKRRQRNVTAAMLTSDTVVVYYSTIDNEDAGIQTGDVRMSSNRSSSEYEQVDSVQHGIPTGDVHIISSNRSSSEYEPVDNVQQCCRRSHDNTCTGWTQNTENEQGAANNGGIPITDIHNADNRPCSEYEHDGQVDNMQHGRNGRHDNTRAEWVQQTESEHGGANNGDYSEISKYEDLTDRVLTENRYSDIIQNPNENMNI